LSGVKYKIGMLEGLGFVFTDQPCRIKSKLKLLRAIQIQLYKIALPLLDRLIFLNKDDYSDLILSHNIKVENISILGGIGLDLNEYKYSEPEKGKVSFIFVGRMLAEKGVHDFVTAAKLVKARYPETEFIMLGGLDKYNPGALSKEELLTLVETGIVQYPGYVDNVADWISSCSVFVLPSYREGLPRSTQEAMAVGRPVITTDVPGCRETVEDGVNGFLTPPWSPQILANKMIYFIENPEQIQKMGLKSYEIAKEKFDEKKVNKKLIGFIESLYAPNGQP
jgi:glycosyltransferase involved in cell wall biosynthesis